MRAMRAMRAVGRHVVVPAMLAAAYLQGAAAMHLLTQLHAERRHSLCRQGQHQHPDQGGTQGLAHGDGEARVKGRWDELSTRGRFVQRYKLSCPAYRP